MAPSSWNQIISGFNDPHLLQTSQWAEVKSHSGWIPHYLVWQTGDHGLELIESITDPFRELSLAAAALILERQILPGVSVMYTPKGPLLTDWTNRFYREQILLDLEVYAKKSNAIHLKIDPDLELGRGIQGDEGSSENSTGKEFLEELHQRGWLFSPDQIQFRNTVLVDLQDDEEQILTRMKSKTRYNIRLSSRKGITIRQGDETDLADLYQMYANTSVRGGFTIRSEDYYQSLWRTFLPDELKSEIDPVAQPLIAEFEGRPVAGAVIFKFGARAWYLHGMSLPEHSDKMAPHLIQWEGIRWAKAQGCKIYDMWGAPDLFDESDPMWGVYRFKSGYGGEVARTIGAWDYPAKPFFYRLYTHWVPRLLNIMRWFGNRQTRKNSTEDPN
jgi:peptidoglycan pentaglycine glycine transferase (the first glycine)